MGGARAALANGVRGGAGALGARPGVAANRRVAVVTARRLQLSEAFGFELDERDFWESVAGTNRIRRRARPPQGCPGGGGSCPSWWLRGIGAPSSKPTKWHSARLRGAPGGAPSHLGAKSRHFDSPRRYARLRWCPLDLPESAAAGFRRALVIPDLVAPRACTKRTWGSTGRRAGAQLP